MGQGSYNNYRMTGQRVNTVCMASGSGLLNTWSGQFDPELLQELGLREEQLSRLVPYDQTFPLTEQAAQALGVAPGIPVIPTNSDGGLNQVGAGAVADGVMTFSVGTSGAMRLTTAQPIIPDKPSTWCYRSPKSWLSGAATNGCCNCVDWLKEQVGLSNLSYSELEKDGSEEENTPVFLPFVFGERCPGWNDEREGGFLRLLPQHKLPDLYLAVQEGVLFNLYHCYQILTQVNGQPKHIRFSGGILHSERWTQMCADIFQQELEVNENEHCSLLGGAVIAMELLGVIDDMCAYEPQVSRVVRPNPAKAELYRKKFQRYLACYETNL
jgi:gluconokinase